MKKKSIIVLLSLLIGINAFSQTLQTPYFCGFEQGEDLSNWNFLSYPGIANKWIVGEAESSRGNRSMYVSADGGATAGYVNVPCGIIAYTTMTLELGKIYDISFDYKVGGFNHDSLFVAWLSEDDAVYYDLDARASEMLPTVLRNEAEPLYRFAGQPYWTNYSFGVTGRLGAYRLVFYWLNNSVGNYPPGACIDNIQIQKRGVCDKPDSLRVIFTAGAGTTLSWKGKSDSYEINYKEYNSSVWNTITGITGNTYTMPNLDKGIYTFWIIGKCGNNTSVWAIYHNYLVASSTNDCLNYTDFYSPDVRATYGGLLNEVGTITFDSVGFIDKGYADITSRHTIHYMPDEHDARTGYRLRTVPPGEVASVRLGSQDNGGKFATITYTYPVVEGSEILLMKYAVVLEQPGHADHLQPKFTLEVLDENGKLLDDICGRHHFFAKADAEGWETELNGKVVWKDWTQFGLNLKDYLGHTVKIKLSSFGCGYTAHYGYAYFTLDCAAGSLSGLTCGENTIDSVKAPDGFKYEWYKLSDPETIVSTNQIFYPSQDTAAEYVCHVISLENENCYFTLDAIVEPHFPKADAEYRIERKNCKNIVTFVDKSYIETDEGNTILKPIETYLWDFGDETTSTEKSPVHIYDKPGEYIVTLKVGINKWQCEDLWTKTITLLPLENSYTTISGSICPGGNYNFNGRILRTAGKYEDILVNSIGCDSIITLYLTINPVYNTPVNDTICFGGTYIFLEQEYTQSGSHSFPLKSIYGCDSTVTLNLRVLPEVQFTLSSVSEIIKNDGKIILSNLPANFTYYEINGVKNGSLTNLAAGEYEITVFTKRGTHICSKTQSIEVEPTCLLISLEEGNYFTCADDPFIEIPYTVIAGAMEKYSVSFNATAKQAGFITVENIEVQNADMLEIPMPNVPAENYIRPGHYIASFSFPDQYCDTTISVPFTINYPSSIITQRWNDILGVINDKYNGGYEFLSYQWYKNGFPLINETKSYLYLPPSLDFDAWYQVLLTRIDDGVAVMTCPAVLHEIANPDKVLVYPTVVMRGSEVTVKTVATTTATLYNSLGTIVGTYNFTQGENSIVMPKTTGIYLLKINEQMIRISVE